MFSNTDFEGAATSYDRPRASVLIVDDDHAAADVLCLRLARQGFAATTVETGSEALELANEQRPDVILLDLRLPDVDGFAVCEQLADEPETADIPIIILSGMEQPDVLRRSRAAGCRFFVHKPYDPNALLTLIEHTLETDAI